MKDKLIFTLVLLAFLAAAFLAGRWTKKPERIETEIVRTDTLTIWDTIRMDRPVYITERVVENIYVPVTDTIMRHDTTFISLPRTQKEYSDSTYHAWVSGYQPSLDSIDVYRRTKLITVTLREPPKKWHIGLTGGYGAGKDGLTPYVGIGLTYSLFSF